MVDTGASSYTRRGPHHPGPLLPTPPTPLTGRRGRKAWRGGERKYPGAVMKIAKGVLVAVAVLAALVLFGRFFLSQLGTGRADGLAGVVLAPPPGYSIVERGELAPSAAAAELAERAL